MKIKYIIQGNKSVSIQKDKFLANITGQTGFLDLDSPKQLEGDGRTAIKCSTVGSCLKPSPSRDININNIRYYMVGGAVRDKLMGKVPHDYDFVVVGASEQGMRALYGESVGKGFPVYLGLVPGYEHLGKVEIAMARKEKKIGEGHTGFTCEFGPDITLEEDLRRRDFTINAIAQNIETDEIVDPYNGQADIQAKIIRCVNPNAFVEDPLRVLRMARFAAKLGFNIDIETMKLACKVNISSLTAERIFEEISKSLDTEYPEIFFNVLFESGHLDQILPELVKLVGVVQAHHNEDAFAHTMETVKESVNRKLPTISRWALLLHDLGKGETLKEALPHHYDHEDRSYEIAKSVCSRLKVSLEYERLATWFAQNHMNLHLTEAMSLGKLINFASDIVKHHFDVDMIIDMSECDSQGRYMNNWRTLMEAISVVLNTKADDIVAKGFTGKKVGELLHQKRVEDLRKFYQINNVLTF